MKKIKEPILITGAGGFIGSNLLRRLIKEKYKVNIFINKKTNLWRIKDLLKSSKLHYINLLNTREVSILIKKIKPKTIFHLAAYGAYPFQNNINTIKKINLDVTVNLIQNCKKYGFKKFINTGSSSEYGFKNKKMSENNLLVPNSHYAVFKSAATLFCEYEAISNRLPITTLRPFHAYGPYEEPSRLIPTLINQLSNNIIPKLVSPNISRDMIYIDDVIDYYILSCNNNKVDGKIINIGSGKNTKIRKIYSTITKYLKSDIKPKWNTMKNRKWDQNIWLADVKKCKAIFLKKDNIDVDTGIKRLIKWYIENKNIYEKINKRG